MLYKRKAIVRHRFKFKRIKFLTKRGSGISCAGCYGGERCGCQITCSRIHGNSGWVTENRNYKYVLQ